MTNKSKKIVSEISAGELLDKISILEIKLGKIKNQSRQQEISKEYKILQKTKEMNIESTQEINQLIEEIKIINLKLWEIEDKIRVCEKNKNFGKEFIELARAVYLTNDKRAKIKSKINEMVGSNIKEIKEYADY